MIRKESKAERRQVLVDVCVSAYPDLCPWQVRQALLDDAASGRSANSPKGQRPFKDLYYYYLSSLLHPQDGHDGARHDKELVRVSVLLAVSTISTNVMILITFTGVVQPLYDCQ